ncbi:MAG: insulinase family protein [Chlorobiales bacterium]|jgi:zinc protease|nr:insulinase family protein [Chlorobiales bacterium]
MKSVEFEEFKLSNGLHGIVHENHRSPIVVLDIWYHVGSKNEQPDRTGFAHLFEHMMFQGSANVGKTEHFAYIQKAGGTANGTTSHDRTNYYETLPSNQLELGLWLESDRMMSLNVNQDNFQNQLDVVKEERRMNYDNTPYGTVYESLHRRAFIRHPYRWTPIGSMADLDRATLDEVSAFFKTYYVPNNATVVIAGDVNPREVPELVSKYFGDIPKGPEIVRPSSEDLPLTGEIRDVVYDNVQLPGLFIAYRICEILSFDSDVLGLLSSILTDGKSSRLYRKLVHEERLLKSIDTQPAPAEHPGLFFISAIASNGMSLQEIEMRIDEEFQKIIDEGVSEEELQKAKNTSEMMIVKGFESMMGIAQNLAHFHIFYGNAAEVQNELGRVSRVTCEDVKRVAKKYFDTKGRVVLHWLPKAAATKTSL